MTGLTHATTNRKRGSYIFISICTDDFELDEYSVSAYVIEILDQEGSLGLLLQTSHAKISGFDWATTTLIQSHILVVVNGHQRHGDMIGVYVSDGDAVPFIYPQVLHRAFYITFPLHFTED